ncbi:MAG TPA: glycosyltransferase family 1 protein [Candidatus Binatia bacterium]|nr:glycosyltransferase family 1 protein [Candidatus Binatia bacterium]
MRILYDHQVFSLQDAGGASRYFYELLKFLATVPEVQAELLLGITGTVYPFRELPASATRVVGFREWLPPGTLRYIANEAWSNIVAPFHGRMHIYHPTTYMRMPLVRARRVVATHHDCTHERFPELFPDARKIFLARRLLFPRVDAIICVSEACRQDLLRFYNVEPPKTRVIHHGLSPLPRSAAAAASLRRLVRRDYILYVGMRTAFKNFHGLLQAFRETRLFECCDLLALGGGAVTEEEKRTISGLGLEHCIRFEAGVSDELLAEAYAAARLFVYPSLNEGFGFPPLEAMSLGCPVLASRIGSTVEVCDKSPFYFDPGDQTSFHRELLRAVTDYDARSRSVELGRSTVSRYRWQTCGQQTLALYRECQ